MSHCLSGVVGTINSFDANLSKFQETDTKPNVPVTKYAVPKVLSH